MADSKQKKGGTQIAMKFAELTIKIKKLGFTGIFTTIVNELRKIIMFKILSEDIEIIKQSRFFDGKLYLQRNPDVARGQIYPIFHYVLYGSNEGTRTYHNP